MDVVALDEDERELADELCRRLAAKHAFGRRVTLELVVEELRVVEVFAHIRIPRGANGEKARSTA